MARFIRVRATQPQGFYRAGMFHGVEPVLYETNDLTADQLRLLREENGRMLLVDDVDDPAAGTVVPNGDEIPAGEGFVSHPEAERLIQEAEEAQAAAEADLAAVRKELETTKAELKTVTAERDAARAEVAKVEAKAKKNPPKPKAGAVDQETDPAAEPLDVGAQA